MFADPAGNGFEASDKETVALSVDGHLLARRNETDYGHQARDFYVPSRRTGWYTLTDDESRSYPGLSFSSILSPRVTFAWHFYAVPSTAGTDFRLTGGFWPSFQPEGLSLTNSAVPGSKTTVLMRFARQSFDTGNIPRDSVTKVRAWFSADGTHWKSVAVHHTRAGWIATVPNPAKTSRCAFRLLAPTVSSPARPSTRPRNLLSQPRGTTESAGQRLYLTTLSRS